MLFFIIIAFVLIFFLSLYLAIRSLSELEVPKEVLTAVSEGKKPPVFWGVILFLKGETVHYSSSSRSESSSVESSEAPTSTLSSTNTPSKSSERIEE